MDNLGGSSIITTTLLSERQQKSKKGGGGVRIKTRVWSDERKGSLPKNAGGLQKQDKARNSLPEAPKGASPVQHLKYNTGMMSQTFF